MKFSSIILIYLTRVASLIVYKVRFLKFQESAATLKPCLERIVLRYVHLHLVSLSLYADVKNVVIIQSASTTLLQEGHVADELAERKHLAQPSRIVHSANREPIPFHVVNTCIFYTSS